MAFLAKAKKIDLRTLAVELGETVPDKSTIPEIAKIITNSKSYEEEFVKGMLETIIAIRKEELEEKRRKEELEEKRRKEELEEKRRKEELEMNERQLEREYELQRLKLQKETSPKPSALKIDFRQIMQKYDDKETDISLYLLLFERQATWAKIEKDDWVAHLLGLLPYDIAQLITREPEDKAKAYDHVKDLLLKRFKLSPEKFRQKFVKHQKRAEATWSDFTYELQNYCQEWVKGLNVTTFEDLLNLMVTDQLKRRIPNEVKDHFIDEWSDIISPKEFASKLDAYETVRGNFKTQPYMTDTEKGNYIQENSQNRNEKFRVEGSYEKRKKPQFFECGSFNHLRPQCPNLERNSEVPVTVNSLRDMSDKDFLLPYTTIGLVNGHKMPILRDSGATIDVVCRKYISPAHFTGETVRVKQPLDYAPICLPIAEVKLQGKFGQIYTKAAVVNNELDQGRYLLGNRTAALIKEIDVDKGIRIRHMNVVKKRAQKRHEERKQLQAENNKLILANSRLESLCRDLQRQNKAIKEENLSRLKVEEEKRKEISKKFQSTLNDVRTLMQDYSKKNLQLKKENSELAKNLKTLVDHYDIWEKHMEEVVQQSHLGTQLTKEKFAKMNLLHKQESKKNS